MFLDVLLSMHLTEDTHLGITCYIHISIIITTVSKEERQHDN